MVKFHLKPGKYAISDLCYLIKDDDWLEHVCELEDNNYFTNGLDKPHEFKGLLYWEGRTYYGDGCYKLRNIHDFSESYDVPVDSGAIGIICLDESSGKLQEIDPELSVVIDFPEEFLVTYDGGEFTFGKYKVNTKGYDEPEIDEGYYGEEE